MGDSSPVARDALGLDRFTEIKELNPGTLLKPVNPGALYKIH